MSVTAAKAQLVIITLITIAFLWATMPGNAHAATPPPPPPKADQPVVLKIIPKLFPPQPGEVIIRDPRALPWLGQEEQPATNPFDRAKDSRTWA